MSAEVASFAHWNRVLRGEGAERIRADRIAARRQEAFHRAVQDDGRDYRRADVALFGPREQLLREGPMYAYLPDDDEFGPSPA